MPAPPLVCAIPGLRLHNKANGSHRHWSWGHRAAKRQRAAIATALLAAARGRLPPLPVVVTVTRVSPGSLDAHDGLPNACKHVVDQVAAGYGLPDNDPRFTWRYAQRRAGRGVYGVEIEIAPRGAP